MFSTSVVIEREIAALQIYESKERKESVVVEKMGKEDAEAGKFLNLVSITAKVLSNPTIQGFRAKRGTAISDLINTCMNGVRDILAQVYSAPNFVLFWMYKLKNSDAGSRLLAAINPDNSKDGDGSVPSGGGST